MLFCIKITATLEATQNRDFCTNAYSFDYDFSRQAALAVRTSAITGLEFLIFSFNWTRLIGRARCTELIYIGNLSDSQRTMTCSQMQILSLLRLPPLEREGKRGRIDTDESFLPDNWLFDSD